MIAFELPLPLDHIVTLEDIPVVLRSRSPHQTQLAGLRIDQVFRHYDIVEEIPGIAVSQRSHTGTQHGVERTEEIARLKILDLGFGIQPLQHARIGRIVVEVAHRHDLGRRIDLQDRVGDSTHLLADGDTAAARRLGAEASLPPRREGQ